MKIVWQYLREYRKCFLFFFLFGGIFAGIAVLYQTPAEAVVYGMMLCASIGVVQVIAGFWKFRRRHLLLQEIYQSLPLMMEHLPPPENLIQEDLQALAKRLSAVNQDNLTRMQSLQKDSMDYFTVWVHQIKTPISAIRMILQGEDTEMGRELYAELFRIEQYAEMALHYVRLDAGSNDFVLAHYSLDAIVKQAVHRYAPLFIRRRLRLDYQVADTEVLTDEKWLVFVVEQLLSNAVKYTAAGGCVTVSFADGRLSVADTGIGIAPEDLPRIFEKGYTGLGGRRDKKSTGLGLYLCKRACGKLGHRITAASEVGVGTVVSVDLHHERLEVE